MPDYDHAAFNRMLEENFLGDWNIFVSTANCFLETFEENFGEFLVAFEENDLDRIARASHRLKGETGLFHIAAVPAQFKSLELCARSGNRPDDMALSVAKELATRLVEEVRAAISEK